MLNLRQQHNFSTVVSCKSVANSAKQGDGACIGIPALPLSSALGKRMHPKP